MDNASKALIMAGGTLISLLIISLAMYVFTSARKYGEDSSNLIKSSQNEAFNRFFVYSETSGGLIRRFEAFNIINKIIDINTNFDEGISITLNFNGANYITEDELRMCADSLVNSSNISNAKERNVTYHYSYGNDGRINQVSISG